MKHAKHDIAIGKPSCVFTNQYLALSVKKTVIQRRIKMIRALYILRFAKRHVVEQ